MLNYKVYRSELDKMEKENPFGVPISRGGWAVNGQVIGFGPTNSRLHEAFPDIIDGEYIYPSVSFIYGTHPGSSISFVSAVSTESKRVGYGNNRADYSFIAGGIVPGVLVLPPDFPENKEDGRWGERMNMFSTWEPVTYY